MYRKSITRDYPPYTSTLLQRSIGRLGFLLVVLVSVLLYAVSGPVAAGERLIAVVEVKLTEFAIEMPTTAPPGPGPATAVRPGAAARSPPRRPGP